MGYASFTQGVYTPQRIDKYKGTTPVIYRSSLELLFMRWCDRNDNIIEWSSESIVIPYLSPKDGKFHRYFVDNAVKLKTPNGIQKLLIEIKPDKQTRPPTATNRKSRKNLLLEQLDWAVNTSKWQYAREWCSKNGFEFVILTEKQLK